VEDESPWVGPGPQGFCRVFGPVGFFVGGFFVRNKAIKERIKERKIDTENLTWFGYNVYAYVHDYTRK